MATTKIKYINLGSIFAECNKQTTKEGVISVLKFHDNLALRQVLKLNYDATCNIKIADEELALKENDRPSGLGDTCLLYEAKRMYVFFEEYEPNLKHEKRVQFLANLLESVDKEERRIYMLAKNKKLVIPFITASDINAIYNVKDLIVEPVKETKSEKTDAVSVVVKPTKRKASSRKKTAIKEKSTADKSVLDVTTEEIYSNGVATTGTKNP